MILMLSRVGKKVFYNSSAKGIVLEIGLDDHKKVTDVRVDFPEPTIVVISLLVEESC